MAYSNWGGNVYKNGERRKDKEDVGVFDTEESNLPTGFRIFANILKNNKNNNNDWYNHSHHAVLGDGPVRLCGYKDRPELWVIRDDKVEQVDIEIPDWDDDNYDDFFNGEIEINGQKWQWEFNLDGDANKVDLTLIEPDGTKWEGFSGYGIGAGFDD